MDRFAPEHPGKLDFHLEALDHDAGIPHENPAISLLLCSSKGGELVEYALGRPPAPALVAQSQSYLPDKKLLATKLQEFYALNAPEPARAESACKAASESGKPPKNMRMMRPGK